MECLLQCRSSWELRHRFIVLTTITNRSFSCSGTCVITVIIQHIVSCNNILPYEMPMSRVLGHRTLVPITGISSYVYCPFVSSSHLCCHDVMAMSVFIWVLLWAVIITGDSYWKGYIIIHCIFVALVVYCMNSSYSTESAQRTQVFNISLSASKLSRNFTENYNTITSWTDLLPIPSWNKLHLPKLVPLTFREGSYSVELRMCID